MKKLKSILFSLIAITMVTVFLSSCEYDPVQKIPTLEQQTSNDDMPKGHLSSKLDLRDKDNPESGALISISTNNEEIFAQLSIENFKAEIVSLADLEKLSNENIEDVDRTDESSDGSLLNTEEHFFSVKILAEYTNEGEFIKYTFGDELLKVLKKYKAQTHISHNSGNSNSSKTAQNEVKENAFNTYGDGGVIPTKIRVFYDYNCGGSTHYKTTDNGFYNNYTFKSCKYPYAKSSRKRYKYFTVVQDVLRSYVPFKTSDCSTCSKASSCRSVSLHSGNTSNGSLGGVTDAIKSDLLLLSYFNLKNGDTWYAGGTNESAKQIWCDVTAYYGSDPVSEKDLKGEVVDDHYQSGEKSNQLSLFAGAKARGDHGLFAPPYAGDGYQKSRLSDWKAEQFARDSFITICPQGVIPPNVEKYSQSGNNQQAAGRDLRYCDYLKQIIK